MRFRQAEAAERVIVGMMEHTGGRVERERCRAGGAFWQFAIRALYGIRRLTAGVEQAGWRPDRSPRR